MGVAGQIGEHLLGSCEGASGVDVPFAPTQRGDVHIESYAVGEGCNLVAKQWRNVFTVTGLPILATSAARMQTLLSVVASIGLRPSGRVKSHRR